MFERPRPTALCLLVAPVYLALLSGCGTEGAGLPTSADSSSGGTSTPVTTTSPPATTPTNPTTPTTPTSTAPAAPTGLSTSAGNNQLTVIWAASSGATKYNVKRATTSGGPYTQVGSASAASYSDSTVSNGTTYFYVISALDSAGESANSTQVSGQPFAPTPTAANCGLQLGGAAIFCDTFDAPAGVGNGNRAGDLNGNVWGVSRATGNVNFGGNQLNMWNATVIQRCDGTMPTVVAPNDILICNGQLREASNDNNTLQFEAGTVTVLAMYPKQPFDFAGRTGTVSFDVSNDTAGTHASWPEFWLSDLPIPAPFSHFDTWESLPANGLAVRLGGNCDSGSQCACPNSTNINSNRWTVDSAAVIRNYVMEDSQGYGPSTGMTVTVLDCVTSSNGPGAALNHVEVRISQNQIDVYATDAGVTPSASTLKHIAVVKNANLTLSRGLIWIDDAHYNADKGDAQHASQRQHTFAWDNVAFDGPFVYRDFSFDAPDNTAPGTNGAINLGQASQPNQTSSWNIPGMPANPNPTAVRVLFNFSDEAGPNSSVLNAIVNGHAHSVPSPFLNQPRSGWRTFAITVPVTDLVAGTNVVQLGSDQPTLISNVNIVLVNVPGGVPVLPGANNAYPAGQ
jgi:hypothetical protein